ncbi:MAG: leucine-rich repeat protein, partial [Candidatus Ornithomonoglobus sp.]
MSKKLVLAAIIAAMLTQGSAMVMAQAAEAPAVNAAASMELSYTDGTMTWYVTGNTLNIEGINKMNEFEPGTAPWYEYRNTITTVHIDEGVESIGRYAFYGFTNLQTVSIPTSLVTVGDGAFMNCSLLNNVTLPEKLYSIGTGAFSNCTSLTSIVIPKDTRTVGENSFAGCTKLASYEAPFIGERKYPGADLANETIYYVFGENVPSSLKTVKITNDAGIAPSAFEGCSYIQNISVNSGVQVIGSRAFKDCSSLNSFVIPDGVPAIEDETFMNCSNITSIVVPDSVQAIGISAFENCYSVDGLNVPYGISVINDYTFKNCSSLTTLAIPLTVNSVGSEVMKGCDRLASLKIPFIGESRNAGMNGWEEKGVFGYLFGYTTVPNGQTVEGATYQYLSNNTKYYYYVPRSLTTVEVDNRTFDRYGEIDDTLTIVPKYAFANCKYIEHIAINAGKTVYENAFRNCKSLKSLALPSSVSAIKSNILFNSQNVESITVPFTGSSRNDQGKITST